MNFQQQTITLDGNKGTTDITAMVAVGVGLAYHEDLDGDIGSYSVTHVASGHNILMSKSQGVIVDALPSEAAAECFIETIAHLVDWNLPQEGFDAIGPYQRSQIFGAMRQAYQEAIGDE